MGTLKKVKLYYVIAIGLAILMITLFSEDSEGHGRHLSSADEQNVDERINGEQVSNNGSTDLYAVINTPKMGTGGLIRTLLGTGGLIRTPNTSAFDCTKLESNTEPRLRMFDCLHGQKVLRTHFFDIGSKAIERHRKNNSEGKCLIVTAIRSPATWFASSYAEKIGNNLDDWPSEEALPSSFREFIQKVPAQISHAIPGLLNEFGGGSLQEQFEIMDSNGGYSLLGPAPPQSIVAGCNLLFLRMEQSDQWPAIFKKVDPTIDFTTGASKTDLYPDLTERMKIVKDYEITIEEMSSVYQRGDENVKDWFDAYGYTTENALNGQVLDQSKRRILL